MRAKSQIVIMLRGTKAYQSLIVSKDVVGGAAHSSVAGTASGTTRM